MHFVGFDPGGKATFGWAVLTVSQDGALSLRAGIASHAEEALDAVSKVLRHVTPEAIGIDAPLVWNPASERQVDQALRYYIRSMGGKTSTVGHVNSLRGACLVQGVAAAQLAALRWPRCRITETHPKALIKLWPAISDFLTHPDLHDRPEHVRDAAVSAYCAWAGKQAHAGWHDLLELEDRQTLIIPGQYVPSYWFPAPPERLRSLLAAEQMKRRRNQAGHKAAEKAQNLDQLIAVYKKHFARGRSQELDRYHPATGVEFSEVVRHAAMGIVPTSAASFKKESHQNRLKNLALKEGFDALMAKNPLSFATRRFVDLHAVTTDIANDIPGLGETWAFDSAFRLSIFFQNLPDYIPLHAGCREGAERLFGKGVSGPIPVTRFRRLGCILGMAHLESFLCNLKDHLRPGFLEDD